MIFVSHLQIDLKDTEILQNTILLLIEWYRNNRRKMPWREEPTPYHVWLSEIMLQQTRIEAVISYYERFLRELPTVEALAAVPDDKLMKLWEGLGYYSRARNLKKAAETLVSFYGGELPEQASELRKLPGIGDYTAGAIASIAFGQPEPAVDGNVLRVYMRLIACDDDIMLAKTKTGVTEALRKIYPSGPAAADLTEGLMELGEVICIPNGTPKCSLCPLHSLCRAYLGKMTERYPVRSPKKQRRTENRTILLLSCDGKCAICQREQKGLLAGMWEFPNIKGMMSMSDIESFLRDRGIILASCEPCGKARHIFTHVEWHMDGYRVECPEQSPCYLWRTPEEIRKEYAIPSAFRFYMELI